MKKTPWILLTLGLVPLIIIMTAGNAMSQTNALNRVQSFHGELFAAVNGDWNSTFLDDVSIAGFNSSPSNQPVSFGNHIINSRSLSYTNDNPVSFLQTLGIWSGGGNPQFSSGRFCAANNPSTDFRAIYTEPGNVPPINPQNVWSVKWIWVIVNDTGMPGRSIFPCEETQFIPEGNPILEVINGSLNVRVLASGLPFSGQPKYTLAATDAALSPLLGNLANIQGDGVNHFFLSLTPTTDVVANANASAQVVPINGDDGIIQYSGAAWTYFTEINQPVQFLTPFGPINGAGSYVFANPNPNGSAPAGFVPPQFIDPLSFDGDSGDSGDSGGSGSGGSGGGSGGSGGGSGGSGGGSGGSGGGSGGSGGGPSGGGYDGGYNG